MANGAEAWLFRVATGHETNWWWRSTSIAEHLSDGCTLENPDIIALAKSLGRTPGSVARKLCNFASLDPALRARDIKGLSHASRADAGIFAEFSHDLESLASESEAAKERLKLRLRPVEDPDDSLPPPHEPTETD
jgi:putative restriction endonuclease